MATHIHAAIEADGKTRVTPGVVLETSDAVVTELIKDFDRERNYKLIIYVLDSTHLLANDNDLLLRQAEDYVRGELDKARRLNKAERSDGKFFRRKR